MEEDQGASVQLRLRSISITFTFFFLLYLSTNYSGGITEGKKNIKTYDHQ